MHWADVAANKLIETHGTDTHINIATGITPSGHIHIGNMREILTADMVRRALEDKGIENTLIYIGDTFDPLRKVYPFLDESYAQYVGMPLSEIPCPCGGHENYAEHFLEPFLRVLDTLSIPVKVIKMHEVYASGKYAPYIRKVLENAFIIRDILRRISGRDLDDNWLPYTPKCEKCGKMNTTVATGFEYPYVTYKCECGHEGKADIRKAEGKLPWRVDWPARWNLFEVHFEPFGKDHGAAGGSYDTGSEITRRIFGREPPQYVMYEWIQLKGKGVMSSSSGIVVSAEEMVSIVPPEVMRFLIARVEPKKHIDFDPGLPLLDLVDEFDRYERVYYGLEEMGGKDIEDLKRIFELSTIRGLRDIKSELIQVSFRHVVTLVQLYEDENLLIEKLLHKKLDELDDDTKEYIHNRIECARKWLKSYAPDAIKFEIKQSIDDVDISDEEREILRGLADHISSVPWEAEKLQNAIFEYAKSSGYGPRKVFKAAYRALLGKDRGPKLGFFISTLDRDFILSRFRCER